MANHILASKFSKNGQFYLPIGLVLCHNLLHMIAKQNPKIFIFQHFMSKIVKIVSRPERFWNFSTVFQCILFFMMDNLFLMTIDFISSEDIGLDYFNDLLLISADFEWLIPLWLGGFTRHVRNVTSGTLHILRK